jgi:hypothetical protein
MLEKADYRSDEVAACQCGEEPRYEKKDGNTFQRLLLRVGRE